MKAIATRLLSVILSLMFIAAAFSGCGKDKGNTLSDLKISDCAVMHETEFGGIYIDKTIDDFNSLGFQFGDSVDISFSNGYELKDIPYYNGYYTQTGEPLLVGYPGYPYIKACINNGDDLWATAGVDENTTAEIALRESGKYKDVQQARDLHYEDDRDKFASDEIFANFRSIKVGAMKENTVYRSASPCDNQHNRAPYVDALIKAAGVNCIINLADNEEKIEGYINSEGFASPYFLSLYNTDRVVPLALNMNFASAEFKQKVVKGLTAMVENDGPYLIHCTEGKDRTGFVCILLEAFCGASYDEITEDYMITYYNYYGIDKQSDADKYDVIVKSLLNPMLSSIIRDDDTELETADLAAYAKSYLLDAGMTEGQLAALRDKLCVQLGAE